MVEIGSGGSNPRPAFTTPNHHHPRYQRVTHATFDNNMRFSHRVSIIVTCSCITYYYVEVANEKVANGCLVLATKKRELPQQRERSQLNYITVTLRSLSARLTTHGSMSIVAKSILPDFTRSRTLM